jgi:hypothetical protein
MLDATCSVSCSLRMAASHHHSCHHCNDDSYSSTTMTHCDSRRNYMFLLARASQIDELHFTGFLGREASADRPRSVAWQRQGKGDQLEKFVEQSLAPSAPRWHPSDCGGQANPQASSARERPAPRVIIATHLPTRR